MSEVIRIDQLHRLVAEWTAPGRLAAGPSGAPGNHVLYAPLANPEALLLNGFIRPANSIKEFLFPRHEALYGYRTRGKQIELAEISPPVPETLILGARPCDAAALPILDPLFNWDSRDDFYNRRRDAATVVTLACREFDDACFCTSVGIGPAAEKGSDALLLDLGDGLYEVRAVTEKGRTLLHGRTETSNKAAATLQGPDKRFDPEQVRAFLQDRFEDPIWRERSLRCLGCGACAYTCPTCHCFDIVDEKRPGGGRRVRNWDSCQFAMFTLHASGHNPRASQPQRQRQRILHKFSVYPEKFGSVLCTGCGNCVRNCPVGLGVLSVLEGAVTQKG